MITLAGHLFSTLYIKILNVKCSLKCYEKSVTNINNIFWNIFFIGVLMIRRIIQIEEKLQFRFIAR